MIILVHSSNDQLNDYRFGHYLWALYGVSWPELVQKGSCLAYFRLFLEPFSIYFFSELFLTLDYFQNHVQTAHTWEPWTTEIG